MFWGGYIKELKEAGRNDTDHNEEIPTESVVKIQEKLAICEQIMECDKQKDAIKYNELVKKLPVEYQQEYHRLFQYGAFFIIAMYFARRGREGMILQKKYLN